MEEPALNPTTLAAPDNAAGSAPVLFPDLVEEAREYIRQNRSEATRRLYARCWSTFCEWCDYHRYSALPAEPATVALFLTELARERKPATINSFAAAISIAHQEAALDSPTHNRQVRDLVRGIRRTHGTAQAAKTALQTELLRQLVVRAPDNLLGIRDRALLLVGFASAARRSEIVAWEVRNICFAREGLILRFARSKTDQEGAGEEVGVAYGSDPATCPVRALEIWLERSGITEGPVFRAIDRHGKMSQRPLSDRAVALIVKRYVKASGLDAEHYAGHSLRAGFATSAAAAGASERSIMAQGRWRSATVARRYVRHGSLFIENASTKLGL